MHYELVTGNLLNADEQYIAHQCNCVTKGAAFLAKKVFSAFPWADIYKERARGGRKGVMGSIEIRGDGKTDRRVIAMLGQYYPGRSKYSTGIDSPQERLKAFTKCLDRIAQIESLGSIAFPYGIGCGAAGGDWNKYSALLEEFAKEVAARVAVYKLPSRKRVQVDRPDDLFAF